MTPVLAETSDKQVQYPAAAMCYCAALRYLIRACYLHYSVVCHFQSKELKVQLEMALNEAETYRLKYESVKSTLTEVKDRDKRLANIERDVADIKRKIDIFEVDYCNNT